MPHVEAPIDFDPRALDTLLDSLDGDSEAFNDLIATYLADSAQQLAELQPALERNDLKLIGRIAHTLKSTSLAFGARGLVSACAELQRRSTAGSAEEISAQLPILAHELTRVQAFLSQRLR